MKKITCLSLIALFEIGMCALIPMILSFSVNGDNIIPPNQTYTISLDKDKKPALEPSNKTFPIYSAGCGMEITLKYSDLTINTGDSNWATLMPGGYFYNSLNENNKIKGIKDFKITSGHSGRIIVNYGWDYIGGPTYIEYNTEDFFDLEAGKEITCTIPDHPNYFKIQADSSNKSPLDISKFVIDYDCTDLTNDPALDYYEYKQVDDYLVITGVKDSYPNTGYVRIPSRGRVNNGICDFKKLEDNVFENYTNITDVVLPRYFGYLGANNFYNSRNVLKNIKFNPTDFSSKYLFGDCSIGYNLAFFSDMSDPKENASLFKLEDNQYYFLEKIDDSLWDLKFARKPIPNPKEGPVSTITYGIYPQELIPYESALDKKIKEIHEKAKTKEASHNQNGYYYYRGDFYTVCTSYGEGSRPFIGGSECKGNCNYTFKCTPILWDVVKLLDDNKNYLVVARNALTSFEYSNNTENDPRLEYSNAYIYLNGYFVDNAFSLNKNYHFNIDVDIGTTVSLPAFELNQNGWETYSQLGSNRIRKATDYSICKGIPTGEDDFNAYHHWRIPPSTDGNDWFYNVVTNSGKFDIVKNKVLTLNLGCVPATGITLNGL